MSPIERGARGDGLAAVGAQLVEGRRASHDSGALHKAPRSPLVARSVASYALLGAGLPALGAGLALHVLAPGWAPAIPTVAGIAALGAAIAGFFAVRRTAKKLDTVAKFLEQRLAATSSVARRESQASARERALAADLAKKTGELEARLTERALLFDVLRESVSSHDLDSVLRTLVERVGPALRFREVAVLLREGDRLAIRAAWGFADPGHVLGRSIGVGEGIAGAAAAAAAAAHVIDVASAPDYLAFWGEVPRTGSFHSIPIRFSGELIGMLALTRPPNDPLSEVESRYLHAIADQVALAIRNAQLIAELESRATHDALTGLANRRLFEQRYDRAVAEAKRYHHPLSVLAIDIDHFKALNDRCGHAAGDAALIAIARTMESNVRGTDTVARVGGEEFLVILDHADAAEAIKVADKLRHEVAALDLPSATGQPLGHLSISIGVAQLDGEADDGAALLGRADAALYDAKRLGRDRVSSVPAP